MLPMPLSHNVFIKSATFKSSPHLHYYEVCAPSYPADHTPGLGEGFGCTWVQKNVILVFERMGFVCDHQPLSAADRLPRFIHPVVHVS